MGDGGRLVGEDGHGHRGVPDLLEGAGRLRGGGTRELRSRRSGNGEDDGVGLDRRTPVDGHGEAPAVGTGQPGRRRRRDHLDLGRQARRQPVHTAAQAEEEGRVGGNSLPPLGAQAEDQAAVAAGGAGQVGGDGGQAEAIGAAGVDAADERVDQALQHLAAEAAADDLGDRGVGGRPAGREDDVEGGAGRAGRTHDTSARERQRAQGHAEDEAVGEGAQLSSTPQPGAGGRRRHQLVAQAEVPAEVGSPGHPAQEGVGPEVEGDPALPGGADLPADPLGRFHDDDVDAASLQVPGGGQPGDARADDDDPGLRQRRARRRRPPRRAVDRR